MTIWPDFSCAILLCKPWAGGGSQGIRRPQQHGYNSIYIDNDKRAGTTAGHCTLHTTHCTLHWVKKSNLSKLVISHYKTQSSRLIWLGITVGERPADHLYLVEPAGAASAVEGRLGYRNHRNSPVANYCNLFITDRVLTTAPQTGKSTIKVWAGSAG